MGKLDDILKKNQTKEAIKKNIPAEGQDVVVKDSVVTEGNEDNVVTQAVVNDAASNAPHPTLAPSDAHAERVQNAAGSAYIQGSIQTVAPDGTLMESSAQPEIIAEAEPSSAARTSNIATGFETSAPHSEKHHHLMAGIPEGTPLSPEVEANLAAKSKGVYELSPNSPKRYFRRDGTARTPQDGFYYAADQEDLEHLDHFAKTGQLVKKAWSEDPQDGKPTE